MQHQYNNAPTKGVTPPYFNTNRRVGAQMGTGQFTSFHYTSRLHDIHCSGYNYWNMTCPLYHDIDKSQQIAASKQQLPGYQEHHQAVCRDSNRPLIQRLHHCRWWLLVFFIPLVCPSNSPSPIVSWDPELQSPPHSTTTSLLDSSCSCRDRQSAGSNTMIINNVLFSHLSLLIQIFYCISYMVEDQVDRMETFMAECC